MLNPVMMATLLGQNQNLNRTMSGKRLRRRNLMVERRGKERK
jgi:hypothetical protein